MFFFFFFFYKVHAIKTPECDNTPASNFVLPKVSYKLPLQVKTVGTSIYHFYILEIC